MRKFEVGEKDLVLGDIVARGATLLGRFSNLYVMTNFKERQRDPLTGSMVYPKRFIVARFLTDADRKLPHPQREQEILGSGCSWAEAFAKAEAKLRDGGGGGKRVA